MIGQMIREQRLREGITLVEVASKTGVSQTHLTNIELGKKFPTPILLKKIAKIIKLKDYMPTVEKELVEKWLHR
jgi:transcriptional regulator with XRE-family HTH domain